MPKRDAYTSYMTAGELDPRKAERTSARHKADAAVIEEVIETATWGSKRQPPELYVKADWVVRLGFGLLGGLLLVAAIGWGAAGYVLFSPPAVVCADCSPTDLFRWTQLLLMVAGVATLLVFASYLLFYAFKGRIWPHRRRVAYAFGILAAVWSLVVLTNYVL